MKKRTGLLLMISVALIVLLSGCAGSNENDMEADGSNQIENEGDTEEKMADEQVLNLASTSEIPTMDVGAAVDATSSNAMGAGFSGLMRLDENEQPVPDMAAEEPEISEDQKSWTFKIREDAEWSNGDPVTAHDFEFSWKRALSPKTNGEYSFLFEAAGIKNAKEILDPESDIAGEAERLGVTAVDDETLEVELSNPQPYFESLLWFGPFLPMNEDVVNEYGDQYAQEVDTMVYNGPYIMSEWNHGEGWTWEKNDDYWNADAHHLQEVHFTVVKDVSTQAKLFDQDEIAQTDLNGDELIAKYQDDSGFDQGLDASTMSIRIGQRQPTLKNEKIRTALYNGIDREALTDVLLSDGSIPAYYEVPKEFVDSPEGEDFREAYPDINKLTKEEAIDLWSEGLKEE
ncbi:MAG TPA: peptide ABC transporter substrate-binding protein, partial [Bacillota bacterium]|nr:peptide ABC transporter substrate-binding protein [Bacillota bacterium]